jgi:SEC-C motif/Protein of unknown function (DUF1186)
MLKFDESKAGKDSQENWRMSGFAITGNFEDTDSPYRNVPHEIEIQRHELNTQAFKGTVQIIKKLERLIEKHPKVPSLYNYLSIAYMIHGNAVKFEKINELAIKKFPDYPLAFINMAIMNIQKGDFDKAETLLGRNMELTDFLPDRQIFHISEVAQYYETTVRYFLNKREFELADNRLNMLKGLSKEFKNFHDEKIKQLELEKERILEIIRYEKYDLYSVEGTRKEWVKKSNKMPSFTHPEIKALYEYSSEIPKEKIEQLLALPRNTLVDDLHKVLDDAMARFNYFHEKDWAEETHSFPVHALLLLAELRSKDSLKHALNLIRQDDDWGEYWFSDMITELFPMLFYKMIDNDLSILKSYLLEPNNGSFQRMVITSAMTIMAYHHPDKRSVCIAFLEDILNDFYENRDVYEDIIDIELIESIVSDLVELDSKESLPLIEKLYSEGMILGDMTGDLEDIKSDFSSNRERFFFFNKIPTIQDDYEKLHEWNRIGSDEDNESEDERLEELKRKITENDNKIALNEAKITSLQNKITQLSGISPKVGRNDPCPCGSGKKYKKCHGTT